MTLFNLNKKYFSKGKSHFLKIYEDYFFPFKNKKINILEIGVYEGKSLMIWKDYFLKANIIGVDLLSYNFKIKRIFTFQGDQTDTKFLLDLIKKFKKFDIIIDVGSHVSKHHIRLCKSDCRQSDLDTSRNHSNHGVEHFSAVPCHHKFL